MGAARAERLCFVLVGAAGNQFGQMPRIAQQHAEQQQRCAAEPFGPTVTTAAGLCGPLSRHWGVRRGQAAGRRRHGGRADVDAEEGRQAWKQCGRRGRAIGPDSGNALNHALRLVQQAVAGVGDDVPACADLQQLGWRQQEVRARELAARASLPWAKVSLEQHAARA